MANEHRIVLSRRRFLTLMGATASAGLLHACAAPPAPSATAPPAAPPKEAAAPTAKPAAPAPTTAPAAQPTTAPAAIGPKQTFIYGFKPDPANWDPASSTEGHSAITVGRCYDTLISLKPGIPKPGEPLELVPNIAESWKISDDGLKYTFKLRTGLKFADGSPLDAKAVKWSFDRTMTINKGTAAQVRMLKSTEAPDAATVEMTLSEPFAYFLPTIASWSFSVINPKVMEHQKDNDWGQAYLFSNAMGSGPYVVTEYRPGQQIQLDYNPNWYGKEPGIKRIFLKIIPEANNLRFQLEKGDIDYQWGLTVEEVLSLQGKPGVRIVEVPGIILSLLYLNNTKPPLDSVKVRQAISHALNYDELIATVLKGKGRRLRGPLAFSMEGYDESLKGYDFDPQRAKQLLAEAGYGGGAEVTLTYSAQGAVGGDEIAAATQGYLANVGIKVKIEKIAEPARRERIDRNEVQMSVGSWVTAPLPQNTMFRWYYSKNAGLNANRAFYTNPQADELILSALGMVDQNKRIVTLREAQKIVVDEAPYVLISQADQVIPIRDNIEGFEPMPGTTLLFNYERLSKK